MSEVVAEWFSSEETTEEEVDSSRGAARAGLGAGGGLQRAVAGGRGAAARILTHNILSYDVTKLRTVTTFYDEPHAANFRW